MALATAAALISPMVGTYVAHNEWQQQDYVIMAKCKNCDCGGPHKHPNTTKTSVILQCPVVCRHMMRTTEFCDDVEIPADPNLIRPHQPPSQSSTPNGSRRR